MNDVRNVPSPHGGRVETGPVRFGHDWPGLFIRGDDCIGYAQMLGQGGPLKDVAIAQLISLFFTALERQ